VKYALDTNIFIDGFRSEEAQAEVFAFLKQALPFTYLSAVVMQELATGARTADAARALQRGIFDHSKDAGECSRRRPLRSSIAAAPWQLSPRRKDGSCSTRTPRCSTTR
jgi:PIN domain-containing protein